MSFSFPLLVIMSISSTFKNKSLRLLGLVGAFVLLSMDLANAQQSLSAYWDFTKYGTVSAGNTVVSNVFGSISGTLNSTATSLTSSGLAITGDSSAASTGIRLANGSLSSFTGDFSIQMWYTMNVLGDNRMLFGGTTSASVDNTLVGDNGLFVGYSVGSTRFVRPVETNGTQYGTTLNSPSGTGNTTGVLYDLVLTYVASSDLFTLYLNGVQVAQGANTNFATLDAVTNFSIGGVANPAFGDNAARQTTTSFLMYQGALTAKQISDLHALGAAATLAQIGTVVDIPEPSLMGIGIGVGLIGLIIQRVKKRRANTCP
jgi:hypothetical protein